MTSFLTIIEKKFDNGSPNDTLFYVLCQKPIVSQNLFVCTKNLLKFALFLPFEPFFGFGLLTEYTPFLEGKNLLPKDL